MTVKPMLAATLPPDQLSALKWPKAASSKLDGIRAIVMADGLYSRSLKKIPNANIQKLCKGLPIGFDGELIIGPPGAKDVYHRTTSSVMAHETAINPKDFHYFVFDTFNVPRLPFQQRYDAVKLAVRALNRPGIDVLAHKLVYNEEDLLKFESSSLFAGFEGVMLRDPLAPYKFGRSTLKEGGLIKLKRFEDGEAEILGFVEKETNTNESVRNVLGYLEKSTKKAGKVGAGVLGALSVKDVKTQVEFEIGSGFDDYQREKIWEEQTSLLGQLVKYKYQAVGVKDKPRFPVFMGFRSGDDL